MLDSLIEWMLGMRLSIFAKLTFLSIILLIIASAGIGFLIYQSYHEALVAQETRDLRYEAAIDSAQLLAAVDGLQQDLHFLNGAIAAHSQSALLDLYQTFMQRKTHYYALEYWQVDSAGVMEFQWQSSQANKVMMQKNQLENVAAIPIHQQVQQLSADAVWLSDVQRVAQGPLLLQAAMPLFSPQHQLQAVVMLTLDLSSTWQHLQTDVASDIVVQLTTNDGKLLSSSASMQATMSPLTIPALTDFFQSNRMSKQISFSHDHQQWMMHVSKVHLATGMSHPFVGLLLRVPAQQMFSQSAWLRQQSLLIVLLVLTLTIVLTFILAKRLTRDLYRMTRSAEKVSQGKDADYLPLQRQDEIGVLARAFSHMLAKIDQRTLALQQSNAELTQFAYVASHDMKEPLRKVQTFGSFLQQEYQSLLPQQGQDFLTRMINAVERMRSLIDALLDYASVANKPQHFKPADLDVLLQEVLHDLSCAIQESQAEIVVVDPLQTIECDAVQLKQLLQNLLANALKFHKPKQKPQVTIRSRLLQGQENPLSHVSSSYQLEVSDEGIGFSPAYAEKIFSMFQRLHTMSDYVGTGIGLATCKRIVQRHGGEIYARSEQGSGATFTVILPLEQINDEVTES